MIDRHRSKVKVTGLRDGTLLFEGTVISQKLRHRKISIFFVCPIKRGGGETYFYELLMALYFF